MRRLRPMRKCQGVYEHPKGSGVWWVETYDQGKRRRQKAGSWQAASMLYHRERELIRQRRLGLIPQKPPRKVPSVAAAMKDALARSKHLRSYREYARAEVIFKPVFGMKRLDELETADIERWRTEYMKPDKDGKVRSPSTINRHLAFLKRVYSLARLDGFMFSNPVSRVKLAKECQRVRYLSTEELTRLKKEMGADWPFIEFAIVTGMRQANQFGLTWKQVDLEHGVLQLPHVKGDKSLTLPLTPRAVELLREQRARAPHGCPWVWPTARGNRRSVSNYSWDVWRPALERAGISDFRWHDLRHTFASYLAMKNVGLRTIQTLMGHSTPAMTARYAHLAPGYVRDEVSKVDEALRERLAVPPSESPPPSERPAK